MLSSALSQPWTTVGKNELDLRSQRKKLIQKQPFKIGFLDVTQNRYSHGQQKKINIFLLFLFFLIFSWPHTIQGKLL